MYIVTIVILLSALRPAYSLIAYDCNGQHLNITTISLVNTGECNVDAPRTQDQEVYIQLLQVAEYEITEIIQCKVEIVRTIYYCGMHSHVSVVQNGYNEYLHDISAHACKRLHQDGTMSFGNGALLTGLKVNATSTRTFMLAGSLNQDGTCAGSQFSDPYGSWTNVVVQGLARITLKSGTAAVKVNSNQIRLHSGTTCPLHTGTCIDSEDGHTFWSPMPTSTCHFDQYQVLYEGLATKVKNVHSESYSPEIYTLTTHDVTFALTKLSETKLCGYTLLRTEHPKLFILETEKGSSFAVQKPTPVENLDIFAYMNSKFVYVEKHIKTQMATLYNNVIAQKCELEKQVLKNALSIAALIPDEFAWSIMKGPGYMAITAGEVIHIVKCIPVQVKVRHAQECFEELPVLFQEQAAFMMPKTRILKRHGSPRDCSNVLPIMYQIDDAWHRLTPKPIEVVPPQELHPITKPAWKYVSPSALATSGIYSENDIDKLRDHIMFPTEKAAILNTLARGVTGHQIPPHSISLMHLLDEEALETIADNTLSRLWNGLVKFGSVSAAIFALIIIFRTIKMIIDTIIHGYELHAAYGCGLHLFGALWTSVTHLLMHKSMAKSPRDEGRRNQEEQKYAACEGDNDRIDDPIAPHLARLRERLDRIEQIS